MEGLERPAWSPSRQCSGTNRAGDRCQRQPIPGGTVCVMHGGRAPQAQAAAKLRLLAMVDPVLATFEEILDAWHRVTCTGCGHVDEHGVKCVGCGKPTGDPAPVIRIGQLVLDRSGFHPSLTVEQAAPPNPYEGLTEDEIVERLEHLLESARRMRDVHRAHARPEATDAVLLDDAFIVPEDDEPPIQEPDVPFPQGTETPEDGITDKSLEHKDLCDV